MALIRNSRSNAKSRRKYTVPIFSRDATKAPAPRTMSTAFNGAWLKYCAANGLTITRRPKTQSPRSARRVHAVLRSRGVGSRYRTSAQSNPNCVNTCIAATTILAIATRPKSAGVRSLARIVILVSPMTRSSARAASSHEVLLTSLPRVPRDTVIVPTGVYRDCNLRTAHGARHLPSRARLFALCPPEKPLRILSTKADSGAYSRISCDLLLPASRGAEPSVDGFPFPCAAVRMNSR